MPRHINLLGYDCELVDIPPHDGQPMKALVLTDTESPHDSYIYPMPPNLVKELRKELARQAMADKPADSGLVVAR